MAKINRPNANVKAFASEALSGERTIFNSSNSSDDLQDNLNPSFNRGFGVFSQSEFPTLEDFNAFGFTSTQLLAYLYQQGVPEWSSAQEYHRNSMASVAGAIYVSNQNNNVGNNPLEGNVAEYTNWTEQANESNNFETSSKLSKIETTEFGSWFVQVDTNNTVNVFREFTIPSNDGQGFDYSIVNEFSDQINMSIGGDIKVIPFGDNRFCVVNQNEIGVFEIDFNGEAINPIGNRFDTDFATTFDYQIVRVAGSNLTPTTSEFLALWNGDTDTIDLLEFDGTSFTNLGAKFSGLTGEVLLATGRKDTQSIIAYSPTESLFYKMTYDGTQFDLDGTTSTIGFDAFDDIQSSFDDTIISINKANATFRVISTLSSSLFEVGDEYQSSLSEITSVASNSSEFASFFVASSTDDNIVYVESVTQTPSGGSFWRPLSARGLGFDGTGTALQSTNVEDAIKESLNTMIYGVGQPFFSKGDSRNPNEILGFGTWMKIEGKFIAGASDTDPDFAGGTEGGSKTHTHNYTGSTSEETVETVVPRDGWGAVQTNGALPEPSTSGRLVTGSGLSENAEDLESLAHASQDRTIESLPHSHELEGQTGEASSLPPYEVFYMWVRIA